MRRILHEDEFFFYLLNVDAVLEYSSTQDSIRQQFETFYLASTRYVEHRFDSLSVDSTHVMFEVSNGLKII